MTIIGDMMLLAKEEKRENIGDAILINIYLVGANIGNVGGRHDPFIAVDLNRMFSRTDIIDMIRVGEQVDRALAVK